MALRAIGRGENFQHENNFEDQTGVLIHFQHFHFFSKALNSSPTSNGYPPCGQPKIFIIVISKRLTTFCAVKGGRRSLGTFLILHFTLLYPATPTDLAGLRHYCVCQHLSSKWSLLYFRLPVWLFVSKT